MTDFTYRKFVKRWEQVVDLPPQTMGPFTLYYKKFAKIAKNMPWPLFVATSIVVVAGVYLALGSTISYMATLLQKGF